jgi:hypothetical protein
MSGPQKTERLCNKGLYRQKNKALMTKAKRGDRGYGKILGSGLPRCIKNRTREKYLS